MEGPDSDGGEIEIQMKGKFQGLHLGSMLISSIRDCCSVFWVPLSRKMKGVAMDPSSYGGFGDSKARIKHQTLLQDYQDLQKMNLGLDYFNFAMTNQVLIDNGNRMMDETDQAIERLKKVVHDTINVGTDTAAAMKAQTEQMSGIVNELDSIHFSIKKASKLVKEIGRQVNL
ncbi:putative plant SNARE 11 [Camellia lanceoleosa]|uniref:Plant SNARE 11 n=1 Tax=Camellia lanceoleosa TaxID=1840588 RepID=A0ACC0GGE0_9ERIC|nr:putative plant SNARE 11 [Camellia lanceoleosa]